MRVTWILGLVVAILSVASAPALAHTGVVSSDPVDGSRLDAVPPEVVVTFSDVLGAGDSADQNTVAVLVGGEIQDGWTTRVDGNRLVVTAPDDAPEGAYAVNYRVISADGHPVTGGIEFGVGEVSSSADGATSSAWTSTALVAAIVVALGILAAFGLWSQRRARTRRATGPNADERH